MSRTKEHLMTNNFLSEYDDEDMFIDEDYQYNGCNAIDEAYDRYLDEQMGVIPTPR